MGVTLSEIPRAALTAGQIAEYADFISFGTNDLTQTTFGISRDDAEVDKYIADPLCGFALGADAMASMMEPSMTASTLQAVSAIRKDLPVLFIAGTQDPVNGNMEYLKVLEERWSEAGIASIETHYYDGARHELLNETNKDEETKRVIAWMVGVV